MQIHELNHAYGVAVFAMLVQKGRTFAEVEYPGPTDKSNPMCEYHQLLRGNSNSMACNIHYLENQMDEDYLAGMFLVGPNKDRALAALKPQDKTPSTRPKPSDVVRTDFLKLVFQKYSTKHLFVCIDEY